MQRKEPTVISNTVGSFLCMRDWAARKSSNWLTCCHGTRTPKRTARHIFRGIESLSHRYQHRMPAFGQALHCHGPGPDEHIQAAHHRGQRGESHCKQGKHSQQLPYEIHLQRDYEPQKRPHPLTALVLGLHLSSIPVPHSIQPLRLICVSNIQPLTQCLRCSTLAGRSIPPHLYHLTACGPKMRWYRRYILGSEPNY